jgi:hypothetical protein
MKAAARSTQPAGNRTHPRTGTAANRQHHRSPPPQ